MSPPALDPADEALVSAIGRDLDEPVAREELIELTGVPPALLDAIEREGFVTARDGRFGPDDVEVVRAGMALLDAGLPLAELLDLGRRFDVQLGRVADHAVELFVRFIRDPIRARAGSEEEAAEELLVAFQRMLPATGTIVAQRFRRLLLERGVARARATGEGEGGG